MKKWKHPSLAVKAILLCVLSLVITQAGLVWLVRILEWVLDKVFHTSFTEFISIGYNAIWASILLGIAVVLMFIMSFLLIARRRFRYFHRIIKHLGEEEEEQLLREIPVIGNDEFADLAKAINQMSLQLKEKLEQERELEASKYELITAISHDLKTPMTSIIGYLELLKREDCIQSEQGKNYLDIAYGKSGQLKELVNELFEYTNLQSTSMTLDTVPYNISILLNQLVGESIIEFEEKQIEVIIDNPNKELICNVDIKLMTRVFQNIIKNAIKYGDPDSVFTVKAKLRDQIELQFKNRCVSFSEENANKIFEKFYRCDASRNSENEGHGLGLAIAKEIIQLHKGTIMAEKAGDDFIIKITLKKSY